MPRRVIFDPSAFGFVVSNERKDSLDENASSLWHADLFLGLPRLPPEVVSARLNLSARGPKNLLVHGKSQAGRALYYWSACQNSGVPHPKWISCKCAYHIIFLQNILGLTVFPDFEKAFDCFERNYLQKCLETLSFGPQLQQWINVMYSDKLSCILNDGFATKQFNLGKGVRQGCPPSILSCILFAIGIEILANAIRSKNDTKGIETADTNTMKT